MDNTQELAFSDAHKLDKKIPAELLMKYQGKWYILKAGLEWKANYLFGGGTYGVTTEIIDRTPEAVLARATFTAKNGIQFSNYGEASKANVSNPQMHKYLLHLAVTRAECRVLRMATACGYTSVEEMDMGETIPKELPKSEHDEEPATAAQKSTIKSLMKDKKLTGELPALTTLDKITQREAKELIDTLLKGGK